MHLNYINFNIKLHWIYFCIHIRKKKNENVQVPLYVAWISCKINGMRATCWMFFLNYLIIEFWLQSRKTFSLYSITLDYFCIHMCKKKMFKFLCRYHAMNGMRPAWWIFFKLFNNWILIAEQKKHSCTSRTGAGYAFRTSRPLVPCWLPDSIICSLFWEIDSR